VLGTTSLRLGVVSKTAAFGSSDEDGVGTDTETSACLVRLGSIATGAVGRIGKRSQLSRSLEVDTTADVGGAVFGADAGPVCGCTWTGLGRGGN
jgi:hypothetical protein